ncbi:hypothetical protein CspHIS471_0106310 [Cutaneotrichosporon sp. HIS471]|nr:hypothetical protein CspHIS471_0106310 [Cutaneotrichosporon sp. HIS471]
MEFTATPLTPPKRSVACLAQITLTPDASTTRTVYWRASVGVDPASNLLIITPLSDPPNPVLDNKPAVPTAEPKPEHDTNTMAGKLAHLFHHDHATPVAAPVTDFPGVVDGKPLAGIRVPLAALDDRTHTVDTTANPAYILVPVAGDANDATLLRFEFDNWLSGKAEVEVLAGQLHQALKEVKPRRASTQAGVRSGRDNDGSTHPSGDAQYDPNWKQEWKHEWK